MYRCQQRVRDGKWTRRCRRVATWLDPDGSKHCRQHADGGAKPLVYDDERELVLVVLP